MSDPICGICKEPKSLHIATETGPLTHPREARGEGKYMLKRQAHIAGRMSPGDDELEIPAVWEFVATAKETAP